MPHIHQAPDQHEMTVSGYIVMKEDGVWKCLVHLHYKIEMLMQIGGHVELDQTPWKAIADELREESGYELGELNVLQFTTERISYSGNVSHPVPFAMNTHNVGNEHYHSDICYGFVASAAPIHSNANGQSQDLRWLTLDELNAAAESGEGLRDVAKIYEFLLHQVDRLVQVPAASFSLDKPASPGLTYKRGAPGSS